MPFPLIFLIWFDLTIDKNRSRTGNAAVLHSAHLLRHAVRPPRLIVRLRAGVALQGTAFKYRHEYWEASHWALPCNSFSLAYDTANSRRR